MDVSFNDVCFQQPERAAENLRRLEGQLPAELRETLLRLLAQLPDADSALNNLERFVERAPARVLDYLNAKPAAFYHVLALFSYSQYLSDTLIGDPDLAVWLDEHPNLYHVKSGEEMLERLREFSAEVGQAELPLPILLARFKRQEYLRIALRDVLKLATVAEVTLEISALTDAILEFTLERARAEITARYGIPQLPAHERGERPPASGGERPRRPGGERDQHTSFVHPRNPQSAIRNPQLKGCWFAILSLGKLGGNELNYSSDIDLIFIYGANGETTRGISNKEYFVKLAHRVVDTLTTFGPEGAVFRVDLRLRPEGREGDMAVSLDGARDYYQTRARDWELQALIKARHSAGDAALSREFLQSVEARIYSTSVDFSAIDSVLFARERIAETVKRRSGRRLGLDVKLERGGIRDIEFLAQCLQRLYGGQEPWLRSGGTLFALQKLADKGRLSQADFGRLSRAYVFLRHVEHLLQLENGQQTHRLPASTQALAVLARRAGVAAPEPRLIPTEPRLIPTEPRLIPTEPRLKPAGWDAGFASQPVGEKERFPGGPKRGDAPQARDALARDSANPAESPAARASDGANPAESLAAGASDGANPAESPAAGASDGALHSVAEHFLGEVARHMKQVREIYERLILKRAPAEENGGAFALEPDAYFVGEPGGYNALLRHIESNCPALYRALAALPLKRGQKDLQRFLVGAYSSPGVFPLLCERPGLIERAAEIFEYSPFLTELLVRHPDEIEELEGLPAGGVLGRQHPGGASEGAAAQQVRMHAEAPYVVEDDPVLAHVASSNAPFTEKMALMRRHYRRRLLRIQAHSMLEPLRVFSTLEATTALAEQVLRAAYAAAVAEAARTQPRPEGDLIVVALGRLGIREFDVGSDADLSFLYRGGDPEAKLFWTRVAERLIEAVSAYTGEGTIFSIDTRLRPRGREGELVEAEPNFVQYFQAAAEPWEALTYMKSRVVAGDIEEGTALLLRVQSKLGARFGRGAEAARHLVEMRKRLEGLGGPHDLLKTAPGGYYDIDFILTYLRLQQTDVFFKSLTTPERLRVVHEWMGQLRADQAQTLRQGAVFLRGLEHALRVSTGRSDAEIPPPGERSEPLHQLAARWLPESLRDRPLHEALAEVTTGVRRVFREVFG